jgi:uncharacterized membrane protein YfcA
MPDLDPSGFALLLLAAFGAGFIDAVAGGGGLITVPALLLILPGAPVAAVLATTKCASFAGTAGAAASYALRVPVPRRIVVPAMLAALPASWLGARAVSRLDPTLVRPLILAVLCLVAVYTWWRPDLGARAAPGLGERLHAPAGILLGAALGFYDGLLGPGTGSLLVVALILGFGRDFLQASAAAKFVNGVSNFGALVWFASSGLVLWKLALPMALCNLLGGLAGSRMAMRAGNRWIRGVFLCVVWALILRLGWSVASR